MNHQYELWIPKLWIPTRGIPTKLIYIFKSHFGHPQGMSLHFQNTKLILSLVLLIMDVYLTQQIHLSNLNIELTLPQHDF
jgi:hypothetical protein